MIFKVYTMADNNSALQSVKFYKFGKTSLYISIVHNKQWNRFSLNITRKFSHTNKGEMKTSPSTIYLNLTATKPLVEQSSLAY